MCACGCFLVVAAAAGVAWAVLNHNWAVVIAIIAAAVVFGWFGSRALRRPKAGPS
jgi:hypothetical protein